MSQCNITSRNLQKQYHLTSDCLASTCTAFSIYVPRMQLKFRTTFVIVFYVHIIIGVNNHIRNKISPAYPIASSRSQSY